MKTNVRFIFILELILLQACKKCGIKKKDTNQQEFLSYWFFGAGSIWVYELNSTSVYDTVTIMKAAVTEELETFVGEDYHSKGRFYELDLLHSNHEAYGNYYNYAQESRIGANRVKYDDWIMTQNFEHAMGYPTVFSNFIVFDYPYLENDSIYNSTYISDVVTLTTDAGTFDNTVVIKTYHNWYNDSLTDPFIQELYLSPGVGTTKIVMTNNMTWNLVSFKTTAYCEN